jgi:hypothetical protein
MSYMHDLAGRLESLLAGLPEEEQAVAIAEIQKIVLESYRNGAKAGRGDKRQGGRKPRADLAA